MTSFSQNYELNWRPAHEAVLTAKPSPLPLSHNVGTPSQVPSLPGIVFPYFTRMNRPDAGFLLSAFSRLFFRTTGDSLEECKKHYVTMKKAVSSLASTSAGQVIAHLLYGIELALQSQTRMFVVLDHGYCGFALLGARWSLFTGASWMLPGTAEEVQSASSQLSTHARAIQDLCDILSACVIKEGASPQYIPEGPISADDVTSGVRLLGYILARKIDTEVAKQMAGPLSRVNFSKAYLPVTMENLVWALEHMTIKASEPLDPTFSLFISASLSNIEDRIYQVLACFGPDVPSFRNASGSTFDLPRPGLKDANEMENELTKAKALPYLLVGYKSITVGYQDMKKVLKDKSIVMDLKERAGSSRNVKLTGNKRDVVYATLKKCIHHESQVEAGSKDTKGLKRKAEDDLGSTPKKVMTASDVLSALD